MYHAASFQSALENFARLQYYTQSFARFMKELSGQMKALEQQALLTGGGLLAAAKGALSGQK